MFETVKNIADFISAAGAILSNGWVMLFWVPSIIVVVLCALDARNNPGRYAPNRARAGWIALAVAVLSIAAGTWHYHYAQPQWQSVEGFRYAQPDW